MSYQENNSGYESNQSYVNNEEPEKKKRGVLVPILGASTALLLLSTGFLGYKFFNEKDQKEIAQQIIIEKTDSIGSLRFNVQDLQHSYDSLIVIAGENEGLKQQLESERQQVVSLGQQLAKAQKNGDNGQAKRLLGELTALRGKYAETLSQIEELKAKNQLLTTEVEGKVKLIDTLSTEKKQLTEEKNVLIEENQQKASTIDYAKKLTASGVYAEAINTDGGLFVKKGTERQTTKAKKADKIRVCFNLSENRIADKGEKMVYMVLKNPSGALVSSNPNVFEAYDGTKVTYSASQSIIYENKAKTMCMDVPNTKFEQGAYTVQVYTDGLLVGESKVELK